MKHSIKQLYGLINSDRFLIESHLMKGEELVPQDLLSTAQSLSRELSKYTDINFGFNNTSFKDGGSILGFATNLYFGMAASGQYKGLYDSKSDMIKVAPNLFGKLFGDLDGSNLYESSLNPNVGIPILGLVMSGLAGNTRNPEIFDLSSGFAMSLSMTSLASGLSSGTFKGGGAGAVVGIIGSGGSAKYTRTVTSPDGTVTTETKEATGFFQSIMLINQESAEQTREAVAKGIGEVVEFFSGDNTEPKKANEGSPSSVDDSDNLEKQNPKNPTEGKDSNEKEKEEPLNNENDQSAATPDPTGDPIEDTNVEGGGRFPPRGSSVSDPGFAYLVDSHSSLQNVKSGTINFSLIETPNGIAALQTTDQIDEGLVQDIYRQQGRYKDLREIRIPTIPKFP